jgi:hypothetical protein
LRAISLLISQKNVILKKATGYLPSSQLANTDWSTPVHTDWQPLEILMTQAQTHTADVQPSNANPASIFANGAKLIGEAVLPGASLLLDGKFVNGAVHSVAGLGARAALGPIGVALICADSFSKSVTDKFLWDHMSDAYKFTSEKRAAAKAAKAEAKAGADASDPSSVVEADAPTAQTETAPA